jgi:hypothetical protein
MVVGSWLENFESVLLSSLETWWPGTELNRQPLQAL